MLQFFGKVLLSIVLTNWLYSELVLFVPEAKTVCENFFEVARIPTHDEWGDIAHSPDAARLAGEIDSLFGAEKMPFGAETRKRWSESGGYSLVNFFGWTKEKSNSPNRQIADVNQLVPVSFRAAPGLLQGFQGEVVRF